MRRSSIAVVLGLGILIFGLEACSGGGGGGGSGLPTGNLTVTARVITPDGQPIANAAVWIAGHGPFRTDGNGEVTVMNMPSPYQALIVHGGQAIADFWPALTRPDPIFTINTTPLLGFANATLSGAVTGGVGWPVPVTHDTRVAVVIHEGFGPNSTSPDPMTGAFSFMDVSWSGPIPTSATLVGLQFLADANGDPVSFTGFGSLAIPSLVPGADLMNQNIALAPVPTTMITGMLTLPPGLFALSQIVLLRPAAGGFMSLPGTSGFVPSISKVAPVVPGVSRDLLVFAQGMQEFVAVLRKNTPDPALNIVIDVPNPTGLVLPIDDAIGVGHATLFQITPTPGGRVFSVEFAPIAGNGPTIVLHTTESTFKIPDLSDFGITIPDGAEYEWSVLGNGPLASLDEAAVEPTDLLFFILVSNGSGDAFAAATPFRSFTFGQ